jgi:hypothetical protein
MSSKRRVDLDTHQGEAGLSALVAERIQRGPRTAKHRTPRHNGAALLAALQRIEHEAGCGAIQADRRQIAGIQCVAKFRDAFLVRQPAIRCFLEL